MEAEPGMRSVRTIVGHTPLGSAEVDLSAKIPWDEPTQRTGQPTAGRAVGAANDVNRHSVVSPRVIDATGTLVGFGGGLDPKEQLLERESLGLFAGVG